MLDGLIERLRHAAGTPFEVDREALARDRGERGDSETSLAIRVLSGIGGFFASLIFLVFMFLTDIFSVDAVALTFGIIIVVASILLSRNRHQAFLATVIVCGYLLGVLLIMFGFPSSLFETAVVLPIVVIALVTLIVTTNYFLVYLAVVALPCCLLYVHLVTRTPWLAEAAVVLMTGALYFVSFYEHRLLADRRYFPARAGVAVGFVLTLLWYRWAYWFDYELYGQLGVVPLFAGSLTLLAISYRNQHFAGIALGVATLGYFLGQFYYDLRWDLLDKSIVLMVAGVLLLLGYALLHRQSRTDEAR